MEKMERSERIEDGIEHCTISGTETDCDLCPEIYDSEICNEVRRLIMEASPSISLSPSASPSISLSPSASPYSENELEMFQTITGLRKKNKELNLWLILMVLACWALIAALFICQ